MTSDMLHWIKNENIDGFRCDVAEMYLLDFWQQAIPQLRREKKYFHVGRSLGT